MPPARGVNCASLNFVLGISLCSGLVHALTLPAAGSKVQYTQRATAAGRGTSRPVVVAGARGGRVCGSRTNLFFIFWKCDVVSEIANAS